MTTNARIAQAVVGVTCLAFITTGCTTTVVGTATPASGAISSSSAADSDVFADLNACRVLEQLTAGQGFGPGENISKRNECDAVKPEFGAYGLALDPVQGLSAFAATNTGVVTFTINGRDAMEAKFGATGCAVAIEVAEHARAMVTVTMSRTSEAAQSCPNARAFAEILEPLLPKMQ